MKSATVWPLICLSIFFQAQLAIAQQSDSTTAELRLLRSTNERLSKENEALRAEVAALKKQLAGGEATTRPAALSAGAAPAAGEPRKIVYIMDASGSMLNHFDKIREDVRKSIEALKPDQSFAVILDQETTNNPFPKTLLPATSENKARVLALLLKVSPRSADRFITTIRTALALNPDLIWWSGDEPSSVGPAALTELTKLNTRKVKFNTIPRIHRDDKDGRTLYFAWKLATDSGGVCFDESGQPITTPPPEPPPRPPQPQPNVQLKVDVIPK